MASGGILLLAGCQLLQDHRPPTYPAPIDIEQEKRDARFFLAYPTESFLPAAAFRPGIGSAVASPH
jgi:hypothetical protein